jgi:general secretion pathway protein D
MLRLGRTQFAGVCVAFLAILSACEAAPSLSFEPLVSLNRSSASSAGMAPESGPVVISSDTQPPSPQTPLIIKGSGEFVSVEATGLELDSNGDISGDKSTDKNSLFDFPEDDTELGTETGGVVTLNFVDVDVKEIVKSVLGDVLGITYTIDPGLTARVTLKTNTPLNRDELLPMLEKILAEFNIALVPHANGYAIRPNSDVIAPPMRAGSQVPGYGIEILRVRHVAASEIAKIMAQYAPAGSIRIADNIRGLLLIIGAAPQRRQLTDIAATFDVEQMQGMSFGLFPVQAATPEELAKEIKSVLRPGAEGLDPGGVLRFMPIQRLNSILVIASNASDIDNVRLWLQRLDRDTVSNEPQLYVHYVQHGEANQIASTLSEIFGSGKITLQASSGALAPGLTPTTMNSDGTANATSGGADSSKMGDFTFNSGDEAQASGGELKVAESEPAPEATPTSAKIEAPKSNESLNEGQIRIVADNINNALFIVATPKDYRLIKAALAHIDTAQLQVLIEATIAEVTLNDELKYGVEWFFKTNNNSAVLVANTTGIPDAIFPGFSYALAMADTRVVLSALDKVTDVKVLSAPQIMVLDNRVATLQVGDQVPVITRSAVSVIDPDSPIVNSVEFRDTGVILSVTPRVNSSGEVQLDIEQEVSDVVATTTSTIDSPTIQQRKLKSTIVAQDGNTIALGGLIRDRRTDGKSGIPLLMDIPLVGNLFSTTSNAKVRTELLVLLTPHVVRSPEDARAVTDELKQGLQSLEPFGEKETLPEN